MLREVILFFLIPFAPLLWSPGTACGQSERSTIALQELGYRVMHWSVDHGLPSSFTFSVIQSSDGYLWATTLDGLARFDGHRFTEFKGPDPARRWFRRPRLHVDGSGRLWIISSEKGMVVSYEDGEFRMWEAEDGNPGINQHILDGTGKGSPYIFARGMDGARQEILFRGESGAFEPFPNLATPDATDLYEDRRDASLWALMQDGRNGTFLNRINQTGATPVSLTGPAREPTGALHDLFRDQQGDLCLLTDLGVFARRNSEWQLQRRFPAPRNFARVVGANEDWRGNIWIVSESGLDIVDPNGAVLTVDPSPFQAGMSAPYLDREGSVWIATRRGLHQFIPTAFTNWEMEYGPTKQKVFQVSEDGEGRIWFAGEKTVYVLPPDAARIQALPRFPQGSQAVAGWSGSGAYVMGTSTGIFFVSTSGSNSEISSPFPFRSRDGLFHTTRDGSLWISYTRGLVRISGPQAEPQEVPLAGPEVQIPTIVQMVEDRAGRKYISLYANGVYLLDEETGPRRLNPLATKETPWLTGSILADPEDLIWLASHNPGGLGLWDPADESWSFAPWERLTLPFALNPNLGLNHDLAGGFWITTPTGLLRCDRTELAGAVRRGGGPVRWRSFDQSDGLATIACSHRTDASLLDGRGRLWIPTDAGVAMTDPAAWHQIRERIPPPAIKITGLRIDTEESDFRESGAALPPTSSIFEIDYNALHFANPEKISYRYRLLGYEESWNEVINRRRARYQNVPPGEFVFQVTADNGYGVWNDESAMLAVTILPHWWERGQVRVLGVALLLLTAGFLYKLRISALRRRNVRQEQLSEQLIEAQEAERKRIAAELHDNLGQNLLVIKNGLALEARKEGDLPGWRGAFTRYAEAAGDCLSEVRQLSQDLRPHQIDRLGLKVAIESVADRLAASSHMQIAHEIDSLDGLIARENEIHVLRIVQEALGNAVKHSSASAITLRIRNTGRELVLRVEDDGRGFLPEEARTRPRGEGGMGLGNIEERTRMLRGTCRFTSEPGRGTVVQVTIPANAPNA